MSFNAFFIYNRLKMCVVNKRLIFTDTQKIVQIINSHTNTSIYFSYNVQKKKTHIFHIKINNDMAYMYKLQISINSVVNNHLY